MVETVIVEKEGRMQRQCRWRLRLASTLALSKMLLMVMVMIMMIMMKIVIIVMMRNKAHICQIWEAITAHSAESWFLSSKSSIPLNIKNHTSLSSSPKQTVATSCNNPNEQTGIFRIIITKTLSPLNYRLLQAIIR